MGSFVKKILRIIFVLQNTFYFKELASNMVFIVNDLLYCVNFGSLRNWRNVILLAGIYYSTKLTLKTVGGLYSGFKTFCLPLVLARDYKIDYGPWAGTVCNTFFLFF